MDTPQEKIETAQQPALEDGEAIEEACKQMEILYKSRCVQAPFGTNIIIREIKKEE